MRIAVGSIMHESNTFTYIRTPLESFAPVVGNAIFDRSTGLDDTSAGGILRTLHAEGATIVPTVFGDALPSGIVERSAYETMRDGMLDIVAKDLAAGNQLDGVCLALHGSMFVDGEDDPEGDLLEKMRLLVGPDIPIVCALDMHANMTEKIVRSVDGLTAYRTAPHVDKYDTGVRAARMLLDALHTGTDLMCDWVRLPLLLSGEQSETDVEPMVSLIAALREADEVAGIRAAEYLIGFPWADSAHAAAGVVVTGDKAHADTVRAHTRALADLFWTKRDQFDFSTEAYPLDEALDAALQTSGQPVVLADSGDNPTAGSSQELSIALHTLIKRGIRDALFAVLVDPAAMAAIREAGEGVELDLELGYLTPQFNASREEETLADPESTHGDKLQVRAHVRRTARVFGVQSAVIDVDGVTVVVADTRIEVTDPDYLVQLGLRPEDFKIIIVKSGYLSPAYQRLAVRKILAMTPGDTDVDLTSLPYRRVQRPILPLDPHVSWTASARVSS